MTSSRAFGLLLGFAVLFGTARPARADICVAMESRFSARVVSPLLVKTMAAEAAAIWSAYGVHLVWPFAPMDVNCDRMAGSFDVTVGGSAALPPTRSRGVVLGRTYLQLLAIDHAPIHIDYEATAHILEYVTNEQLVALAGHAGLGSAEVGRALGRVLAHELGHVLLAAPNHQPHGLMRPSYVPSELIAVQRQGFTLSKGEVDRLRHRTDVLTASTSAGDLP
jgi:hypothetical protein